MKTWTITRECDDNESFEVDGETLEDALYDALFILGYRISESPNGETE